MIENGYNPKIIEWLETSEIKSWFRVRSSSCVRTTINYQHSNTYQDQGSAIIYLQLKTRKRYLLASPNQYIVVSQPSPFQSACLNDVEWILVGCIPTLIIGIASLVFMARKAWPFLNLGCLAWGLCPRDDATYARRPSHFVHGIMMNMASMFVKTSGTLLPPAPGGPPTTRNTRVRRVRFMDSSDDDVPADNNDKLKLFLINEVFMASHSHSSNLFFRI